ncbi:MAG: DUF4199 domain-containing protein [Gemmatimonadota bacterium]
MKRTVWTFGLIAGAILAGLMAVTVPFMDRIGHGDMGELIGYSTMILAFLMVYFGIRSYRDNVMGGTIGFGRAFKVGILIALIASVCYVAAWEIIYHTMVPDFMDRYAASAIEKARASGATEPQIEEQKVKMAKLVESYKNPFIFIGYTFLEVFPVGVVVVLVCAGVMSRKKTKSGLEVARA